MISAKDEKKIAAMLKCGMTVAEVASSQGVSRSVVYRVSSDPRGGRRRAKNEGKQWGRVHSAAHASSLVDLVRVALDVIDIHELGLIDNILFRNLANRAMQATGYTTGERK